MSSGISFNSFSYTIYSSSSVPSSFVYHSSILSAASLHPVFTCYSSTAWPSSQLMYGVIMGLAVGPLMSLMNVTLITHTCPCMY